MRKLYTLLLAAMLGFGSAGGILAQSEHSHERTEFTGRFLHFAHPLVGESPTPDNKIRPDWTYTDNGADVQTASLTLEYRFTPGVSVETEVPYTFVEPDMGSDEDNLDNVSAELKIANPLFSRHGLQLVHGFGIGLPTGDDDKGIGSNNIVEYEGVMGFGYKPFPDWEVTGFVELGVPTNQGPGEDVETELGWNLSVLKHLTPRWQALLELDGETVLSAEEPEEDGRDVINLSPGVKWRLDAPGSHHESHWLGLSYGAPVSGAEDFDERLKVSYFYHF